MRYLFGRALLSMCFFAPLSPSAQAAERIYYIAAEETEWDYAPSFPINRMSGKDFSESARVFVEKSADRIGRKYLKSIYREYTDSSFSREKPQTAHHHELFHCSHILVFQHDTN